MEEMMKKIGREMGLLMGVSVSLILSLVGSLLSGHFNIIMFLITFVVATIISLILGLIIPMKKLGDGVSSKLKIRNKLGQNLVTTLISDIIYTPIIVAVMMVLVCSIQPKQLDKQIQSANDEIKSLKSQVVEVAKNGEVQKIGELQAKIKPLEAQVEGQTKAKEELTFGNMYPKNLLVSFGIGFFVIFILQMVYIKILFKKHNIPA